MADEPKAADDAVEELSPQEVATTFQEVVAEVRSRRDRLDAMPDGPRPQGPRNWKRRKYMVDLPLQLSYVGVYMSTLVLLAVGFVALNIVFSTVYERALMIQQNRLEGLDYSPNMVLFILINFVFMMLLLIGAAFYAIVNSHRVAGPAYRVKGALRQIQARDYDHYVTLRTKDFLKDLAEQVNVLNQALKAKDVVIADAVLRLDDVAREAPPAMAEQLQEVAADLSDVVLPIEPEVATTSSAPAAPTG